MIPNAVEKQEKEAEELIKKLNEQSGDVPVVPDTPEVVDPETPPVQPVADPVVEAPPVETPPEDPNSKTWEQRFRTLEGKYNAETAELRSDNAGLRSDVSNLTSRMTEIERVKNEPPPPPPKVKPESVQTVERDTPEIIDTVNFYIDERVGKSLEEIRKEMGSKLEKVETTLSSNSGKTFRSSLSDKVKGNVDAINNDPKFKEWLSAVVPYSAGRTRHDFLKDSVLAQDPNETASFFNDYLKENTPPSTPNTPNKNVEKFVSPPPPGGPGSPNSPASEEKVSRSFMRKFYSDLNKGVYRNKEALAQKIEAKIDKAVETGRVVHD
jgi:hypothetical protein